MAIEHSNIPDAQLHETKGAASALNGQLLEALGDGTAEFKTVLRRLSFTISPTVVNAHSTSEQTFPVVGVLADDDYIKQTNINGEYYVSIGGKNVTGEIIDNKNLFENDYYITMFIEPLTRQLYIKKNNDYYDIAGKKVIIYNITDLIVVRKLQF
jgi:hypothetical protein